MASQPFSSSSSSSSFTYDVFLSFRGEDTRMGFIAHLFNALSESGIRTFIDDETLLQKGDHVVPTILNAIENSMIAIVVFSKNYASSSFCLEQLAKINECRKYKGLIVLPVYYLVEPYEVRTQTGYYAKYFSKHENIHSDKKEMVQRWREDMTETANLAGWDFGGYRNENIFIKEIVKDVANKIMVYLPHVSKYPIEYENDFIGRIAEEFSNKINRGVPLHAESQLLEINLLHAEFDNGVRETTKRVVEDDTILWRFVGFVSSIVGLLCYALSPSFTRLIRGWNPLKLGLYVVLAYIIWAIILLAKQRPFSWKSKLTTMVGFVIFMLSNAYSFYFDKVMSGKPDILSMVSNVAFALMAVSFSKVFKIGSDFGVLSCFLALLAAQLMTIHFLLIFVAIFIGFPLFVMNSTLVSKLKVRSPGQNIHSSSHSQPPEVNSGGQAFQPSSNSQPEVGNEGQDIFSSSNSPQVEDGSEGEHAITLIL